MTAIAMVPFAEAPLSEVAALLAEAGLSASDVSADADGGCGDHMAGKLTPSSLGEKGAHKAGRTVAGEEVTLLVAASSQVRRAREGVGELAAIVRKPPAGENSALRQPANRRAARQNGIVGARGLYPMHIAFPRSFPLTVLW